MPRLARAIAVGCGDHITQRGSHREDIFFVDEDRRVYVRTLVDETAKYKLELLG